MDAALSGSCCTANHAVGVDVERLKRENKLMKLQVEQLQELLKFYESTKPETRSIGIQAGKLSIIRNDTNSAESDFWRRFSVYDESAGLYYDASSGFYYDKNTKLFYHGDSQKYYYYDYATGQYVEYASTYTAKHYKNLLTKKRYREAAAYYQLPHEEKDMWWCPEAFGVLMDVVDNVENLTALFGSANQNGVTYFDYDNEVPMSMGVGSSNNQTNINWLKREDGEISSDDDYSGSSSAGADYDIEMSDDFIAKQCSSILNPEESKDAPPCIRVMVTESKCMDINSLHIVTIDGAMFGAAADKCDICVPSSGVSRKHARVEFDSDQQFYTITDLSRHGTWVNEKTVRRVDKSGTAVSNIVTLKHGDQLRIGKTVFDLHIHPGTTTCPGCEPGLADKSVTAFRNREKQRKHELTSLKAKYGLQGPGASKVDNQPTCGKYKDRAAHRRKTRGSDHPYQKDEAPSSVDIPIATQNKGFKMLAKMGWLAGQSLGKAETSGITEPINALVHVGTSGLGASTATKVTMDSAHLIQKKQILAKTTQRYMQSHPVTVHNPKSS